MSRTGAEPLEITLKRLGQEHLLRRMARLPAERAQRLRSDLERQDWALLERLLADLDKPGTPAGEPEPAEYVPWPRTESEARRFRRARARGERLLREGKAAAFVVAGGQGTRLGYEGPKGCFPIGPLSGATLFQWHFEKVRARARRAGASIPLLVMTSEANHEQTLAHFEERGFYGMPREDVIVFRQGMLPAVDEKGRLLVAEPDRLALSPDGHGGALRALAREGILEQLEERGIEHLFYFQVDNPLVEVLDPVFLGLHASTKSDASSKVVVKRDAGEKVGVFARVGGRLCVVEYSDLPEALARRTDERGELLFRAGNVAIHVFRVDFLRRIGTQGARLPFHRARKKVPHVDEEDRPVVPEVANAIKFESFVFDALPLARRTLVVETLREEEFSPVKNAEGEDSPATARRDLSRRFCRWLEACGWRLPPEAVAEVGPLFALDASELRGVLRRRAPEGGRFLLRC